MRVGPLVAVAVGVGEGVAVGVAGGIGGGVGVQVDAMSGIGSSADMALLASLLSFTEFIGSAMA